MNETVASRQRLAAILAADAAGYSRLMSLDESATVAALDAARSVFRTGIEAHQGRVIDMAGDSVLALFETATGAVSAALSIQAQLETLVAGVPADRRMRFRIGVHLGDVTEKADGTVYGDGVNIAARLEGLALPGGITVSDAVKGAVRHRIAASFEDLGEQQVKNIVDPVRVFRIVQQDDSSAPRAGIFRLPASLRRWAKGRWFWPALATLFIVAGVSWSILLRTPGTTEPPVLSFAVLPLRAGAGADQALADSFTRDLTAALARSVTGSSVAPSNAVARFADQSPDGRAIAKDLNVRYLLEGEVLRQGDQLAANLQLFDAGQAKQIWSERIEASPAELPDLPNLLVVRSTLATRNAISTAEEHRLAQREIGDASPNELVVRALMAYDNTFEGAMKAKALCEKAIAAAPKLASAMWCKAWMIVESLDLRPSPMRDQLAAEADNLTQQAIAVDEYDAFAWRIRGEALRLLHQWDSALEANEKAIRLDPSRISNLWVRGLYLVWTGRPEAALPLVERSMKISPVNLGFGERIACQAYISLGRFKDAVAACERSVVNDSWWYVHLYLAVAYAQVGEEKKAAAEVKKAIAREPKATIAWYRELNYQDSDNTLWRQQYDTFFEPGLRKAGLPEK